MISQLSASNSSAMVAAPSGVRTKLRDPVGKMRRGKPPRPFGAVDADQREILRQQAGCATDCRAPASAGAWSDRRLAPKITSAQGAPSSRRARRRGLRGVAMRLIPSAAPRGRRTRLRIADSSFSAKVWSCARAEAGDRARRDQYVGRHRLLDRRLIVQRPSPESSTLPVNALSVGVLGERDRGQVEQPRRDDAAAPPHLGDVGEVERRSAGPSGSDLDAALRRMSKPSA